MFVVVVGLLVKERTVEGKAPGGRTEERRLETFLQRQPRGPLRKAPEGENAVACCTGRSMRTTQGSRARSSMGCMCRNFILLLVGSSSGGMMMMLMRGTARWRRSRGRRHLGLPLLRYVVPVEAGVVRGRGVDQSLHSGVG